MSDIVLLHPWRFCPHHNFIVTLNDINTRNTWCPADNGQSTLDGVIRATNILLAGKTFTRAGFGWCGRGIARRAQGHGATVIITEVNPLTEAAACSDFILTAAGNKHVTDSPYLEAIKDRCILANSGYSNVEINISALESLAVEKHCPRPDVEAYQLPDGRRIRLPVAGRLVNLAAAEGHPATVMDMSFANRALSVVHLWTQRGQLDACAHPVPQEIDSEVAQSKLAAWPFIDTFLSLR